MVTMSELTRKHNEKWQKLKNLDVKRIEKLLDKTTYYEHDFTDKEWQQAIDYLIALKQSTTSSPVGPQKP